MGRFPSIQAQGRRGKKARLVKKPVAGGRKKGEVPPGKKKVRDQQGRFSAFQKQGIVGGGKGAKEEEVGGPALRGKPNPWGGR